MIDPNSRTILLADDEAHLRRLIRVTLEDENFNIIEASDGQEALELASRHPPDLLILDWMMPGTSGIRVLEHLRSVEATHALPVIMLTAKSQKEDREECRKLGVSAYLTKPFSPLELVEVVDQVLRGEKPDDR